MVGTLESSVSSNVAEKWTYLQSISQRYVSGTEVYEKARDE
jgi:hypothetical protein